MRARRPIMRQDAMMMVGNLCGFHQLTNSCTVIKDTFTCKICFDNNIDLVLPCGHPFCYQCFNRRCHDLMMDRLMESDWIAWYEGGDEILHCFVCRRSLQLNLASSEGRTDPGDNYFLLECPDGDEDDCFVSRCKVQGIRIRHC